MPNSSMKVISSNINDVSYDERSQTMSITFHDGSIYNYFNVPEGVYMRLVNASSVGGYFAIYIKGRFTSSRVN